MFDKNTTPNLLALVLIFASLLFDDPLAGIILATGLFALSGALTNWLAVHMLFQRVPGLYGSGVIVLHFEDFKKGILRLVHDELLSADTIDRLLDEPQGQDPGTASNVRTGDSKTSDEPSAPLPDQANTTEPPFDLKPLLDQIDLDLAFGQLVVTIRESSFGSMLDMIGGEAALQPLREPFKNRMRGFLDDASRSPRLSAAIQEQLRGQITSDRFIERLDGLLKARLDELTPEGVRDIMQGMIRRHLGWLVVWGGVFGGLIGLAAGVLGVFTNAPG